MMRLLIALALVVTVACGDSASVLAPMTMNALVGTWSLRSTNGVPLPVQYTVSGSQREIISGTLTVMPTGRWVETFTGTYGTTTTVGRDSGTFWISNDTARFQSGEGGDNSLAYSAATIRDGRLGRMSFFGFYVYTKE